MGTFFYLVHTGLSTPQSHSRVQKTSKKLIKKIHNFYAVISVNNYMREKFGLKIIFSVTMSDTVQVFCLLGIL